MTQREAQILQWIQENPLISQQELAARAGLAASAIAMEGAETINPALNACAVRARAGL